MPEVHAFSSLEQAAAEVHACLLCGYDFPVLTASELHSGVPCPRCRSTLEYCCSCGLVTRPSDEVIDILKKHFAETPNPFLTARGGDAELIVKAIKADGYTDVVAYRYNYASIRLRVICYQFAGVRSQQRLDRINDLLNTLPDSLNAQVVTMILTTPDELKDGGRHYFGNLDFEHPEPSEL